MERCLRHSRHAPLPSTAIARPHPAHVPTEYRSRHILQPGHSHR